MSDPGKPIPPPKEPRRHSGTLLAAIVIAVVLMAIGCAGVCAGVLYIALPRARVALEEADIEVPGITVQPPAEINDWMTSRTLSQVYTNSLSAVVADQGVIERLGDPVLTNLEAEELYRRKSEGALAAGGEQIEYDIKGPKGTGVVAVDAAGAESITKITVTLEDGSTIIVTPPPPQPFIVR